MACAPSNIAVDNIIERLHAENPKLRIVRIGHPARLLDTVQQFCLDALICKDGDYNQQTLGVRKEMNKLQLKLKKTVKKSEKREIYDEFKLLRKDMRQIETQHIDQIFKSADVICSTLTSAADKTLRGYINHQLPDKLFDILVIDECAQSVEPACWIPINNAKKVVMAGDHKQLDPTVKSVQASEAGLSKSIFERVMNHKDTVQTMLVE